MSAFGTSATRRGSRFGIWFFRTALRVFGLRGAYGLLYLVCPYYVWFDRGAFESAACYLRRRFPGISGNRLRRAVFRLFVSQGKNLIDRHAIVAGAVAFDMEVKGREKLDSLLKSDEGFVLLTSHTGNWQAVMAALDEMDKCVHLLMRREDGTAIRESIHVDAEDDLVRVVTPDSDFGGVVTLMRALEEGGVVGIMGDRTYGADGVAVEFFGETAYFPYSAFHIASLSRCAVAVMLTSKTGPRSYAVEIVDVFRPSTGRVRGDRRALLREGVQRYAKVLEAYLMEHPFQYFIFHDLWAEARQRSGRGASEERL